MCLSENIPRAAGPGDTLLCCKYSLSGGKTDSRRTAGCLRLLKKLLLFR